MTITIPVWLLWTLYITGGIVGVLIVGALIAFAVLGVMYANAVGRGLNW
jgi:hypothetical protein